VKTRREKGVIEREFQVKGMHCQSCVALIEEEVGEIDGVESVKVSLDEGVARVRLDPARVPDAAVVAAIREAGYEA
jgi:copper ion binding protein